MRVNSPCLNCPDRRADPNCHNPITCDKWAKFCKAHEEERTEVYNGRMKYAGEAKQTMDSLKRNKYFQSKKREKRR